MPIEVKNFASQADEAKDMPNARMEAVNVLGQRVMKLTLAPGWKWSTDIKRFKRPANVPLEIFSLLFAKIDRKVL